MTPYHPLTSTGTPPDDAAMIWPWPHNWSAQVVRRPEWSTVVLTSATGTEQRQALREYPREQVTYEHLLEGDDAALAFTLLRVWKGRDWLVPDWTEATKTTAPAGAVLSLERSSAGAGMALLGTEVVTLLDANGTLDVSPSGSWPAGTVVVPLRLATLDADQTVSHVTGTVSRISPTFLFSEPVQVDETVLTRIAEPSGVGTSLSRWGVDPSGAPTKYPRAHMLPRSHNYVSPGSTQVGREVDELDPGVGMRHTRPRHDISSSRWSYDTLLESDRDILAFRALLQQHKGSAIGMYASPLGADLEVVEIVNGVATVPGSQFWGSAPPALDLLTPRGWECRKVASVSPSGVVLQNAAVRAAPGEVVSARAVYRVRVLGDAVEIRYHTPGVAEVSLPVVTTPDPFDAGGGGGGPTAGGWTEVAVPVIPPPAPARQVILLVRGESWPLADASPIARSIAVTGVMDAAAGGSPALFGSTASVRALMFPPLPFATATASTTITAAGDFCAECFVRIPLDGTGYGNVRVFTFGVLSFRLRDATGSVSIYSGATRLANVDGVFSLATWYHVAVTRRSGTIYIYLNGTMVLQHEHAAAIDMTTVLLFRPLAYYIETIGAYFKYARITTGDSVYSGASFPPLTSGY